eukprot:2324678-Lingulodinium_polyedra.AAC.1
MAFGHWMDKPILLYGTPAWTEQLKKSITRPKGPKTKATAKGKSPEPQVLPLPGHPHPHAPRPKNNG